MLLSYVALYDIFYFQQLTLDLTVVSCTLIVDDYCFPFLRRSLRYIQFRLYPPCNLYCSLCQEIDILSVCLFVCLFVRDKSSHSIIFHSYWDVAITSERMQILTYARHPLWHETSVDNGHLFTHPWHSLLLPSIYGGSCHYLFLRLRSVATGIQTPYIYT